MWVHAIIIASRILCKKLKGSVFRLSVSRVSLYAHLQCTDELWEEVLMYNDLSLSRRVGTKWNVRHNTNHQLNTIWTVVLHTCTQTGGWGSYKRPIRLQHSTDRPHLLMVLLSQMLTPLCGPSTWKVSQGASLSIADPGPRISRSERTKPHP